MVQSRQQQIKEEAEAKRRSVSATVRMRHSCCLLLVLASPRCGCCGCPLCSAIAESQAMRSIQFKRHVSRTRKGQPVRAANSTH